MVAPLDGDMVTARETVAMAFVQFQRCDICRKNHNSGNKHVYSACHRNNVQRIITKFKDKVSESREVLGNVVVEDGTRQDIRQFWCYFCRCECERDKKLQDMLLKDAAMIAHLSSREHLKNCTLFLAQNRVEKAKKEEFVVETDEYKNMELREDRANHRGMLSRFLDATQESVKRFEEMKHERQLMVADKIRKESFISARMVQHYRGRLDYGTSPQCSQANTRQRPLAGRGCNTSEDSQVRGMRTVEAHGDGLTCVRVQKADSSSGNVFSDALPPWIQSDAANTASAAIGPTLDDLHKHIEKTRKRKLPAERVGANFNHNEQQSCSWLPSFGRVWSTKRNAQGSYRGQAVRHKQRGTGREVR